MDFDVNNLIDFKPIKSIKTYQEKDIEPSQLDSFLPSFDYSKQRTYTFNSLINEVTVFDAASYILKQKGGMTTMKLHKLLYYCQAWSLVWDDAPLFNESIEAWANGPVVKDFFSFHRGSYTIDRVTIGNSDNLSNKQKETIDSVLEFYGGKISQWLIELTHLEEPWKAARVGLGPTDRGNRIISLESMAQYYSSL